MNERFYKNRKARKEYIKPNINQILIDNEISLVLNSFEPDPDEPGFSNSSLNLNNSVFKA